MVKFSLIDLEAAMLTRRNSKNRDRERLSERTAGSSRCDSLNCKETELAEGGRNDRSSGKIAGNRVGNRVYLSIPTMRIPQGVSPEGFASTTVGVTTLSTVHNGVGHISNYYKFTIGRSALRIRPTESFQCRVR